MTGIKRIAAVSLLMALTVPAFVYGAEEAENTQPIKDIKEQRVGVFQCEKNTEEWTKEVFLKASAIPDSGKKLPEVSFLWQGSQGTGAQEGETYTVKENGIYTVKLQLPEKSGLTAEDISVKVENIDTTGPEIINISKDVSDWTNGAVTVTVECEDYQEAVKTEETEEIETETSETEADGQGSSEENSDRAKGSGLHLDGAYSYDGGNTWTSDNFIVVEENTTIDFVVRDALENETRQNITVDNIDKSEPSVRVNIIDGVLYEDGGNVVLSASASDIGSGLAEQPYSWDGGISWTNDTRHVVTEAGNYTVLVRDKAGNYTQAVMTVGYAQRPADTNSGSTGNAYASGSNGTGIIYYGVAGTTDQNTMGNSEESKKETETDEKAESRESRSDVETEEKESESLQVPLVQTDDTSGFPIRWVLIGIAAIALIIGIIVAAKLISERQAAVAGWDDDEDEKEDMKQVYARVAEKESQSLKAVSATLISAVPDTDIQDTEVPDTTGDTIQLDTEVIEEAMAEAEAVETPVAGTPVEEIKTAAEAATVEIPAVNAASVEIPAVEPKADADTVTVKIPVSESEAVVEPEIEVQPETEPRPEVETETSKEPEPVVLEGAHSRLIYDPASGEYKYELR